MPVCVNGCHPLKKKDLGKTLTTDEFFDPATIHRFDCSDEHMGGAGDAGVVRVMCVCACMRVCARVHLCVCVCARARVHVCVCA